MLSWLTIGGGLVFSIWRSAEIPQAAARRANGLGVWVGYIGGWVVLNLVDVPLGVVVFWAGLGLILLLRLLTSFLIGFQENLNQAVLPQAGDFFILMINFYLISSVFWDGIYRW